MKRSGQNLLRVAIFQSIAALFAHMRIICLSTLVVCGVHPPRGLPAPPSRCLHPPTAAEKLHAFISLRRCSQAVTGKWHLTSPTQPTTQAFKKPPRSFPQHCPRQHYTGSLRAALPAPLWPNGLWSSEGREGGEAEYLSPLSAFSLLCTSALPYFWFDFCTLWSECSECLVPPSS